MTNLRPYFTYGGDKIPEPTKEELKKLEKDKWGEDEWEIWYADMFLDWMIDERMDG